MQDVIQKLDITRDVCPMTFVRTRLALDKLSQGELLLVRLSGEEPIRNVPATVKEQGHEIVSAESDPAGVLTLVIRRGA